VIVRVVVYPNSAGPTQNAACATYTAGKRILET